MKKLNFFWKFFLIILLLHVITDWKENLQAYQMGVKHQPFSSLKISGK